MSLSLSVCLFIIPLVELDLKGVIRSIIKPISYSTNRENRTVNETFKMVMEGMLSWLILTFYQ